MTIEQRIRDAENSLFARYNLTTDESFVHLPSTKLRLRVLSVGSGPDLVMLHGVSLAAAIWAPWLTELKGYRAHLVELPGHGLSDPISYRVGSVRQHSILLLTIYSTRSVLLLRPSSAIHSVGCSRSGTLPNDRGGWRHSWRSATPVPPSLASR
jgi:pimeloyl-ACP methyl ester carboxylesterase